MKIRSINSSFLLLLSSSISKSNSCSIISIFLIVLISIFFFLFLHFLYGFLCKFTLSIFIIYISSRWIVFILFIFFVIIVICTIFNNLWSSLCLLWLSSVCLLFLLGFCRPNYLSWLPSFLRFIILFCFLIF